MDRVTGGTMKQVLYSVVRNEAGGVQCYRNCTKFALPGGCGDPLQAAAIFSEQDTAVLSR